MGLNAVPGWGDRPATVLVHDQRTGGVSTDQRSFLEQRIDVTSFERFIAVSFDAPGERMLAQWESLIGAGLDDIGIIDVGRDVRSTETVDGGTPRRSPSNVIQGISATDDPGTTLSTLRSYLSPLDSSDVLCIVDSLGPFVSQLTPEAVYEFVDEFAYLVRATGGQGWLWLDRDDDEWVRSALSPPFDRVLHLADEDDAEQEASPSEPSAPTLSPDQTYDLLTPSRRRHLLHILALTTTPTVPLDHLTSLLYQWDDEASSERHVRLRLLHTDLPKLERYDVVRYHSDQECVTRGDGFEPLRHELRRVASYDFGPDSPL